MKKPAVFLDRDGTLIEEVNFLSRVDDLKLFTYTPNAIRHLKNSGFLVIVVTNQSGIGRGLYTEKAMHSIHDHIQVELDGAIDGFYFCPHLPGATCECRKPGDGMIRSAQTDFDIDLSASWIVGDKKIDVETGRDLEIKTALVLTGYGREHQKLLDFVPDVIAETLAEAATEISTFASLNSEISLPTKIIV